MKRNRLFSLLCAFMPGAGQMYMGLMKRGAGVMLLFAFCVLVTILLPPLMILLPVVYCYSFFDTLNLRRMTVEELQDLEEQDDYFFNETLFKDSNKHLKRIFSRVHLALGWVLIIAGVYSLYDRFRWSIYSLARDNEALWWLASALDTIPTLVVAFLLILAGAYLIRGKRVKAYLADEDYTPYRGVSDGEEEETE